MEIKKSYLFRTEEITFKEIESIAKEDSRSINSMLNHIVKEYIKSKKHMNEKIEKE